MSYTKNYKEKLFLAIKKHEKEMTILASSKQIKHLENMRNEYLDAILSNCYEYKRKKYINLGSSVMNLWQPTVTTFEINKYNN